MPLASVCQGIREPTLQLMGYAFPSHRYERTHAEYISKLPSGKHSTKGLGRTAPDPSQALIQRDGVVVPLGKGMPSSITHSSLLYNEYIVYDVSQIHMKYLLKVDFKFKW